MRDMHCHILPGVDDGSQDLDESFAMLQAAKSVGIDEIVCTPHCRDPYFDYDKMWRSYEQFATEALNRGESIPIRMGFEVNHSKLMELGLDWIDRLAFADTDEFLLELDTRCKPHHFEEYKRTIFEIQGRGFQVIIAHPERYHAIQDDTSIAEELVDMGCELQASTDFVSGGRMGRELRPAKRMLKAGLYTYFASDAHFARHYQDFEAALKKFGKYIEI